MIVHALGRVGYHAALRLQEQARSRVLAGGADELLLLEHDPVVTFGRRGGDVDRELLARLATAVVQTDRGGLATWHGPGQLVAYPIVHLRRRGLEVPAFVALLGEACASLARELGVAGAAFDPARPGVYVDGRKLASLGLHVHRGVSTHGLALNLSCDLEGFRAIVPCGFRGLEVTTVARCTGRPFDPTRVRERLAALVGEALDRATRGPAGQAP